MDYRVRADDATFPDLDQDCPLQTDASQSDHARGRSIGAVMRSYDGRFEMQASWFYAT